MELRENTFLVKGDRVIRVGTAGKKGYVQEVGVSQLLETPVQIPDNWEKLGYTVYWACVGDRFRLKTEKQGVLVFDLLGMAYQEHSREIRVQVRILSRDSWPLPKPRVGWVEEAQLRRAEMVDTGG